MQSFLCMNDGLSWPLVMTGVDPNKSKEWEHIIISKDKKAVWVGCIDDFEMENP